MFPAARISSTHAVMQGARSLSCRAESAPSARQGAIASPHTRRPLVGQALTVMAAMITPSTATPNVINTRRCISHLFTGARRAKPRGLPGGDGWPPRPARCTSKIDAGKKR
jgi:hypothetical protein